MNRIEKNIKINYIYQCFRYLDMSTSIWVLYLVSRGMSLTQIGLLESIYHITSLIFEVPTGAIADLLGRKKTIFAGRLCAIVSSVVMIASNDFWGFALGFILSACGNNLGSGTEEALVYDSVKQIGQEEEYIRINGISNCLISGVQGLGAFIGAMVAHISFLLSYISGIVASILALGTCLYFKEPENHNLEKQVSLRQHFSDSINLIKKNKKISFLLIFYPMISVFTAIIYFYGQQCFASIGMNKISIAWIFLANSISAALGAFVSKYVKDNLKEKVGFILGFMIGICIFLFGVYIKSIGVILFCLISLLGSVLDPISSQEINELIPSEQRATLISMQSMTYSLMMIAIFPLAGFITEHMGMGITFMSMSIILIVGVGICYRVRQRMKESLLKNKLYSAPTNQEQF